MAIITSMKIKMYKVYILTDESNNPYYVGITNNITRRKLEHLSLIRCNNQLPKYRKARKIGKLIINILISNVNLDEAKQIEEAYIILFRDEGFALYNLTDGGDGRVGFVTSKETKEKISKSKKGTHWGHHSDETKERMSKIRIGIKFTDEHKRKLREARKRRELRKKSKEVLK